MAAENSILWWSSSHRVHHKYIDKEWDPYNIRRGFWWAHIFWIFNKNEQFDDTFANSPDLLKNPVVMWQHRWHKVILIVGGFGLPTAIGALFGDPIAGLLWGGFLRIFLIHHTTFFVNSLAHTLGKPLFNAEVSARDNWFVAMLTESFLRLMKHLRGVPSITGFSPDELRKKLIDRGLQMRRHDLPLAANRRGIVVYESFR